LCVIYYSDAGDQFVMVDWCTLVFILILILDFEFGKILPALDVVMIAFCVDVEGPAFLAMPGKSSIVYLHLQQCLRSSLALPWVLLRGVCASS